MLVFEKTLDTPVTYHIPPKTNMDTENDELE